MLWSWYSNSMWMLNIVMDVSCIFALTNVNVECCDRDIQTECECWILWWMLAVYSGVLNTSTGAFILFWQIHPKGAFIWHTVFSLFLKKKQKCIYYFWQIHAKGDSVRRNACITHTEVTALGAKSMSFFFCNWKN